jgi:hypothetical protein
MLDKVNGLFEMFGGFMMILSIRQAYIDKKVNGISIPACMFFATWAVFGTVYYPSLEQWWSFSGAIVLATGNVIWVSQLLYYSYWKKSTALPLKTEQNLQ